MNIALWFCAVFVLVAIGQLTERVNDRRTLHGLPPVNESSTPQRKSLIYDFTEACIHLEREVGT